jgi:hypothetical protein
MNNRQHTYDIIVDNVLSILIITVLYTFISINRDLGNSLISGKYFWFYASIALLSIVAVPAYVVRYRERVRFKLPDLLILLFVSVTVLITLYHTGRLTNKCLLLLFMTAFYFYLSVFLSNKSKLMYILFCLAFVITGLVEAVWGLMQLYGFVNIRTLQ